MDGLSLALVIAWTLLVGYIIGRTIGRRQGWTYGYVAGRHDETVDTAPKSWEEIQREVAKHQ